MTGGPAPARVAIIGAGMAGLTCASELVRNGVSVRLFDKGRGPGGRMATRRMEHDGQTLYFDHGAQYFTARDPGFVDRVGKWLVRGAVASWPAAGDDAYVGRPGMNAPLKLMARDLDVEWGARVESITPHNTGAGWTVRIDGHDASFDTVLCAIPAEQAAQLLADAAPDFAAEAQGSASQPCWAAMAHFAAPLDLPDIIRGRDGPISWAARNSAKPGRGGGESWVIHAAPVFTRKLLDFSKEDAAQALLSAFFEQTAIAAEQPQICTAHRWLYAMAQPREGAPFLWDASRQIGVCGDWLTEPRVEGAWKSGRAMAEAVIESFNQGTRPI